jgi:hypothetical protein
MSYKAFLPAPGTTVSRTVSTTSANVPRPQGTVGCDAVRVVFTAGTSAARIRFGIGSNTTAVATDMLVPNPGTPWAWAEVFSISHTDDYIAAITDAGTCTMEFTFGFGI